MASRSSWLKVDRFVPLGRYWRSSLLVFSLLSRCQGLRGAAKIDTGVGAEALTSCQFHAAIPGQRAA